MRVLRVFNNNVVLAKDGDREVILIGRGLGFGRRQGDPVDPARVHRTFVPADGRDPDHLGEMLAMVPEHAVDVITESLAEIACDPALRGKITLVTALADHLHGALARQGRQPDFTYPLEAEVRALYPDELATARRLLAAINRRLPAPLPESEAIAFALHLVNASFSTGDLSYTYRMTGVIQQILETIGAHFGITVSQTSICAARFITHVRYLFTRLINGEVRPHIAGALTRQIMDTYPQALHCATQVAAIIELRFDAELDDDELAYLTLHIERLSTQLKDN